MSNQLKLSEKQKSLLSRLEPKLKLASARRDFELSKQIVAKIQEALRPTGHETRLMKSKNCLFETAMEVGEVEYAMRGFIGVRQKASKSTRLYLEATALLAICYLRKRNLDQARPFMVEALRCEKNIKSEHMRSDFKVGLASKFDEEALLASSNNHHGHFLNVFHQN